MLKFENFQIYFKHYPLEEGTIVAKLRHMNLYTLYSGRTECIIEEDGEVVAEGNAYCGLGDRFDKSVGRKISLTRALNEYGNKAFSTMVWEKYLATARKV